MKRAAKVADLDGRFDIDALSDDDDNDAEEISEIEEDDSCEENEAVKSMEITQENSKQNKRAKLSKGELFKPPTSEELHRLKETENLYHSSLFRLQIDELLNEVKMKRRPKFDVWMEHLKEFLLNLPDGQESYTLTSQEWIAETGCQLPIRQIPFKNKGSFKFLKPSKVQIVGGYPLNLTCKPRTVVDLAVEMPKGCIHNSDYLNHRYHRKRAMYLVALAQNLQKSDLVGELKFTYFSGDTLKPALIVSSSEKSGCKKLSVRILLHPPAGHFKISKFAPFRNNVRPSWFFQESQTSIDEETPTPRYNCGVVADMMLEQHFRFVQSVIGDSTEIRNGITLLKVWAQQRQLSNGFGAFGPFIITMYVVYLLKNRKLNSLMSSYQIFRNTCIHLAQNDWSERGISLLQQVQDGQPSVHDFHSAFEVVFVDPSGFLNICANMSKATFKRIRHEAEVAVRFLDSTENESFEALFMTPAPFISAFDYLVHIRDATSLKSSCEKLKLESSLLDNNGNYAVAVSPKVVELLNSGLSKRVKLLAVRLEEPPVWLPNEEPPLVDSEICIGLLSDPEFCTSILDKGPPADKPEALQFREFWGDNSQLRRFQDGSTCEAVVWPGTTMSDRRMVSRHIVEFVLSKHLAIAKSAIHVLGNEVDVLLTTPLTGEKDNGEFRSTGEEQTTAVLQSFDDLGKQLRKLDGLPLDIHSIQGVSPIFRYSEVFPPKAYSGRAENRIEKVCGKYVHLNDCTADSVCQWIQPMEAILHLETSGKWPEDTDAISRLKAAFHIRLSELLEKQCRLLCVPHPSHVDVMKDGFAFRLIVASHREIISLKTIRSSSGMIQMKETAEAMQLATKTEVLPKITSALHGIQMQHSVYSSTCRLIKRWISAQLLYDHIPEIAIDLIVARIFLSPAPFAPPSSPQVGFFRVLRLLSAFDWQNNPLIVNLNDEFRAEEFTAIHTEFVGTRANLPPMILFWLTGLAKKAVEVFENQFQHPERGFDYRAPFRPPLDIYDVIIHLKPTLVPDAACRVDFCHDFSKKRATKNKNAVPVIDFNPVVEYLRELKEAFDEFALFFYDKYGGTYIAVLWKPSAFQQQPFKVNTIGYKMVLSSKPKVFMATLNTAAIVEDFVNIGEGLVENVETKSEKWTFAS